MLFPAFALPGENTLPDTPDPLNCPPSGQPPSSAIAASVVHIVASSCSHDTFDRGAEAETRMLMGAEVTVPQPFDAETVNVPESYTTSSGWVWPLLHTGLGASVCNTIESPTQM